MSTRLAYCFVSSLCFAFSSTTIASENSLPGIEGSADADVSVVVSDGVAVVDPGGTVVWTVALNNAGPDATIAQLQDNFPSGVSAITWTCASAGGAICSAAGTANISDVVYLPLASTLVYTASGTLTAPRGTTVSNSALVGNLNGVFDPAPSNNIGSDSFVVDFTMPPIVAHLDSAASPLTCNLYDGIETKEAISQVLLRFDQPMANPAGNTAAIDVTNPASYAVIAAGNDGALQTTSCSNRPAGDDQIVAIHALDFDPVSVRVSLHVDDAEAFALPAGSYRVLACSAGLQRDTGVSLDGDHDGTAGGDFVSDFRVLETNLIPNPNFDYSHAAYWQGPSNFDDPLDSDSSPWSHSMGGGSTITRCVSIGEPGNYRGGFRGVSGFQYLRVELGGPGCVDSATGAYASEEPYLYPAAGIFNIRRRTGPLPVSSNDISAGRSVRVTWATFAGVSASGPTSDTVWLRKEGDKLLISHFDEPYDCIQ